jgi:hypothetical protein
MVDFAKIRADRQKEAEVQALRLKAEAINKGVIPTWLDRINHLIEYHLTELDNWQEGFVYSVKEWLVRSPDSRPSEKQQNKIKEIEDQYCGQVCHALQKAGIPHATPEPTLKPKRHTGFDDMDDDIPF